MIHLVKRTIIYALVKWDVGMSIPIITFLVGGLALLTLPQFGFEPSAAPDEMLLDVWLKDHTRLSLAQWAITLMVAGLIGVWRGIIPRAISFMTLILFYFNFILFATTRHSPPFSLFIQVWGMISAVALTVVFAAFRATLSEYTRAELENRKLRTDSHAEVKSESELNPAD